MDSFDGDFLNKSINIQKQHLKNKFDTFTFTTKELKNNVESLCIVWDYSPRVADEKKHYEVYKIKQDNLKLPDVDKDEEKSSPTVQSKIKEEKKSINDKEKEQIKDMLSQSNSIHKKLSKIQKLNNSKSLMDIEHKEKVEKVENITTITIVNEIPNNAEDDKKEARKSSSDDSDNEAYFEKIRQMRNERATSKGKKQFSLNENILISNSTKRHRLTENTSLRIYLFTTQIYLDFQVFYGETIKDLKIKILSLIFDNDNEDKNKEKDNLDYTQGFRFLTEDQRKKLEKAKAFSSSLPFGNNFNAYELRLADEDEDVLPNYDFPQLENNLNLLASKWHTLCLIETKNFTDNIKQNINLGFIKGTSKIVLKIYNKTDILGNISTTVIEEDIENDMKTVIERLERKKFFTVTKNINYYFICEHIGDDKEKKDELDCEINPEMQLKYLTSYEIDISVRKYSDAPEAKSLPISNLLNYNYSRLPTIITRDTELKLRQTTVNKKEEDNQGREYAFNDFTASAYQEFDVVKINKYNTKQERVLGIDRYHIYNNFPKNNKEKSKYNI